MATILIVDDEPVNRELLLAFLDQRGHTLVEAETGQQALEQAEAHPPDLVLLDVMLPDIDGFEVLRRIRANRGTARSAPVIMLSARGAELDRVRGLELGADDYVTKPFSLMELLARVASVLRRSHGETQEPVGLAFGALAIDLVGQVALRGGKRIELPSRAFAILKVFAKRPGEVVSRDVLLDEAWGYEDYPNTRTVDNHLVKLRRALEDEPDKPRWLVTIHGAGYKLDVPRDAVRFARSVTRS